MSQPCTRSCLRCSTIIEYQNKSALTLATRHNAACELCKRTYHCPCCKKPHVHTNKQNAIAAAKNNQRCMDCYKANVPLPVAKTKPAPPVEEPKSLPVHYFINEAVEALLVEYKLGGTKSVELRDEIMGHSAELIRQLIRKQCLHKIYGGGDESNFNDLVHIAWRQIERTLYKFRAAVHCRKCYSDMNPAKSILWEPALYDYEIKSLEEVASLCGGTCPNCKAALETWNAVRFLNHAL